MAAEELDLADLLAGTTADLVRLIGVGKTLSIVQRWGGIRVYVPADPPGHHPLVELVGQKAARIVASHYAGERLEVPRAVALVRELRDREIRQAYDDGATQPELALHYNLTQRQIRTILSADDAPIGGGLDVPQVSLF